MMVDGEQPSLNTPPPDSGGATRRGVRRALAPLLLLLLLLGGGVYSLTNASHGADLVQHTQEVSLALGTLQNLLTDIETGERGYLVTTDARFLEPAN